ncbi:MAG: cation/multidrug efflux pump [Proteobacteria bacterium]|nr:cation/multidrug efflux pump [Pseudomonadota bacterium]NOG61140.1 cation/multidrug efflux pump [Pseudomonadota bacterium]
MLNELFNLENTLNLDYRILVIISALLLLSVILFILASKHFLRGKPLTASFQGLSGLSLMLAGLLFLSIAINLFSYDRLTYEQSIAELKFNQLDDQQFEVEITYKNQDEADIFLINGDEWQMDARIIKWKGWTQLLGLNAQYRLERIGGRYSDIEEELAKPRTAHALGAKDEVDYWKLINDYKKWLPWVDAYYGSATYLPMSDKAAYLVSLTQSGLIARPLSLETEEKTKSW